MCADDGSSNIWTIQNRFETKQNSDKPTMSPRKSTNRGNSATRIGGASSVAPASSSVIGVVTELRRYPSALRAYFDVWFDTPPKYTGRSIVIGKDPPN